MLGGITSGRWRSLVHTAVAFSIPGAIIGLAVILESWSLIDTTQNLVAVLLVYVIPFAIPAMVGAAVGTGLQRFVEDDGIGA